MSDANASVLQGGLLVLSKKAIARCCPESTVTRVLKRCAPNAAMHDGLEESLHWDQVLCYEQQVIMRISLGFSESSSTHPKNMSQEL
jgi:hypothetical protein